MNSFPIILIDRLLALLGLIVLFPLIILVIIAGFLDTGSPLFFQQRVGKKQRAFTLIKFRTMLKDTASVATHKASRGAVAPLGKILRNTKLDELPQLINVLKGEMSLVGPRPCLFNQQELIDERQRRGVYEVLPGITGLAQINHIDMSDPPTLAKWDQQMIESFTLKDYFKYLLLTLTGSGQGDRVK